MARAAFSGSAMVLIALSRVGKLYEIVDRNAAARTRIRG